MLVENRNVIVDTKTGLERIEIVTEEQQPVFDYPPRTDRIKNVIDALKKKGIDISGDVLDGS